jgi:hypothetical protein
LSAADGGGAGHQRPHRGSVGRDQDGGRHADDQDRRLGRNQYPAPVAHVGEDARWQRQQQHRQQHAEIQHAQDERIVVRGL